MIGKDDEWICDFCDEPNGEFNEDTGNHIICEEMRDLHAKVEKMQDVVDCANNLVAAVNDKEIDALHYGLQVNVKYDELVKALA